MDKHFLKGMNAQKLAVTDAQQRPGKPCSVESAGELELLVKDGHHEVNGDRNPDLGLHRIGTCTEEGACQNDASKPSKVHVAAIHHIEGTRFEEKVVEPVNIGIAGSRDVDAGRDRASEIELGVHLDPSFGASEIGPWEETQ